MRQGWQVNFQITTDASGRTKASNVKLRDVNFPT